MWSARSVRHRSKTEAQTVKIPSQAESHVKLLKLFLGTHMTFLEQSPVFSNWKGSGISSNWKQEEVLFSF